MRRRVKGLIRPREITQSEEVGIRMTVRVVVVGNGNPLGQVHLRVRPWTIGPTTSTGYRWWVDTEVRVDWGVSVEH